ncbi:P-loop NTPase fold protein [Paraburkholderia caribensis]|uniref:P-loop NTPase fold protein n=1 Tax=Paraburkholderia caribensis TaxID=75105 RepID=UPI00078B64EB|nr:P-loop NTPase fold protein [Paraburkholderia caribensis]AMV47826.1 hypothetical protein ATN79_44985 [Paraburkholderia caribensis]
MTGKNQQIRDFLSYYFDLQCEPQYAVLIRGNWGSGKTWFIRDALRDFEAAGGKHLYVSLYGVSSIKGIEDEFFRLLHPVLSSKSMALAGKLAKGLLKGTLKIDLDGDGKDDGTATVGVPDLDLSSYLKDTKGFVLVFDDVERCMLPMSELLGYINYFVEHNGYKAVLIANEDEITRKEDAADGESPYQRIKEKLVGKTLEVEADIPAAVASFVAEMVDDKTRKFVVKSEAAVTALYLASKYNNLRHLRQALLDFERLMRLLTPEQQSHEEMLQDFLGTYLMYSFEVKSGSMAPQAISSMMSEYVSILAGNRPASDSQYSRLSAKYLGLASISSFLPQTVWVELMTTGLIGQERLVESINQSRYFAHMHQPEWRELWDMYRLTDDRLEQLIPAVEAKLKACQFERVGEIRHVAGALFDLADLQICNTSKADILLAAKANSDVALAKDLRHEQPLLETVIDGFGWGGFGFHGREHPEFAQLTQYIRDRHRQLVEDSYPDEARGLLQLMQDDISGFVRALVPNSHEQSRFYRQPVLAYIAPDAFVRALTALEPDALHQVQAIMTERYAHTSYYVDLVRELPWLENVRSALEAEVARRAGKMSGELLKHIWKAIEQSEVKLRAHASPASSDT